MFLEFLGFCVLNDCCNEIERMEYEQSLYQNQIISLRYEIEDLKNEIKYLNENRPNKFLR